MNARLRTFGSVVALGAALSLAVACGGRSAAGWAVDRYVGWKFDDVEALTTDGLAARLQGPVPPLLLDVRTAAEYEVSHLPTARRVEPGSDPAAVLGDVPLGQPVVVYCSVGWRSGEYAQRMAAAGFTQVANLEGSVFRWAQEGRPLVDGAGEPTTRVHAFGAPWSWLVDPDRRVEPAEQ